MIAAWVFLDNLRPFLTALGWIVGYEHGPDELTAIEYGLRDTEMEADRWYAVEFAGHRCITLSLALDPGSSVVNLRVEVPAELEPQVQLAIDIFAYFHLRH